eukprot:c13277_g1_i2 orf=418-657(+)
MSKKNHASFHMAPHAVPTQRSPSARGSSHAGSSSSTFLPGATERRQSFVVSCWKIIVAPSIPCHRACRKEVRRPSSSSS